jgi:hypothetical protein
LTVAARPSIVADAMPSAIASRPSKPAGDRFRHASGTERHDADAGRAELASELAAHRLDGAEEHLEAAEVVAGHRMALAAERQQHA